jgi:uncharacterized protein with PIN domain
MGKGLGDKTSQNQRYYEKYREQVLAKHREYYQKNKVEINARLAANKRSKKGQARSILQDAVRCGRITRPSICQQCQSSERAIQAHHENYDRPLDVVWLCTKCHGDKHTNKQKPKAR